MTLKNLALAIQANHPNVHLIILLVDEHPEEVTDLRHTLSCNIVSSTFDEPRARHAQVSEMVSDRSIAEQQLFPAIHLIQSATRREELLHHPQKLEKILQLRSQLSELPAVEALQILLENIQATNSNAELLLIELRGV